MNNFTYYPAGWRRLDILAALQENGHLAATCFREGLLNSTSIKDPALISADSIWPKLVKSVGEAK